MTELPLISICIPLYNRDKPFYTLLESIEKYDAGMPYEICLGEEKQATSKNRNLAMSLAKSNFICQLDGDAAITHDGWLKQMYDTLIQNEKFGIVGCVIEFPTGKVDHCGTLLNTDKKIVNANLDMILEKESNNIKEFFYMHMLGKTQMVDFYKSKITNKSVYKVYQCSGVCFLFDRRKTGIFSEEYKKAGWEDVDFMARTMAMGFDIVVTGGVRIKHPNTIRDEEQNALRDQTSPRGFDFRNLTTYMIKWRTM